jgi:Tol biopolymer transport system component
MRRIFMMVCAVAALAIQLTAQSRSFKLAEGQDFTNPERYPFSLSADGTRLTYMARAMLWIKTLNGGDALAVRGPVEARGKSNPIFAPDGQSILYWAQDDSVLERVPVGGGTPVRVARVAQPLGLSWGAGGQILVGQGAAGIVRVPASGGTAETIVKLAAGETALAPQLLPDGDHVLFSLGQGTPIAWTVVAQSLKTGQRTRIVAGSNARYLPGGVLVYVDGGNIVGDGFDAAALKTGGQPVTLAQGVDVEASTGAALLSVAPNGVLVSVDNQAPPVRMALVGLDGKRAVLGEVLPDASAPRLSRDGKQVAFAAATGGSRVRDIYVADVSNVSTPRKVISNANFPVFSPDGQWIAFGSLGTTRENGEEALFLQRADGSGEPRLIVKPGRAPENWIDGDQGFTFITHRGGANNYDAWAYSIARKEVEPMAVVEESAQLSGAFSPDRKWHAYMSNESGDWQVYVQPYPKTGATYQVTSDGGRSPMWLPDGRLVFEHNGSISTVSLQVAAGKPTFTSLEAHPISGFIQPLLRRSWDVSPDGRLLMLFRDGPKMDVANVMERLQARARASR